MIERENAGPAVIVGHAYGNWVARMTAVDHPKLVRGVVLAAAAAKKFPPRLSQLVSKSADASVPEAERLDTAAVVAALRRQKKPARELPDADAIVAAIAPQLLSGDVVVILSNGAFGNIYEKLPQRLRSEVPA